MKYQYEKSIKVEFENLPVLIPEPLNTNIGGFFESLRGATSRRIFNLERDWNIKIEAAGEYKTNDIFGTIIIPKYYSRNGERPVKTRLDGASVPLPWLISFLSFGTLRPLGVMMIGSIVHDFAFEHGGLLYRTESGETTFRAVPRHIADQLFFDIIKTVNNMPITALLAWLAVRLGWFWVKYDGKPRGSKFPRFAVGFMVGLLLILAALIKLFGLSTLVLVFVSLYLAVFLLLQLTSPNVQQLSEE